MASVQVPSKVSSPLVEEILGLDRRALDRARISRDPRFDGKFFIAVKSTGIYCRPICPSPTSKIGNVRYYPTAAAAAEAGYRPCLRCRPEAAPGTPAWLGTSAVVRRALRFIDEGFLDQRSVEQLAERLGIGARHLHRLFVQHVGASPITVAQTRRLHFAKRLLDETELPITEIALAAGFGSLRRFNSAFQQTYARAPRELRRQRRERATAQPANEVVLKLAYRSPYDWEHMRDFLAARAVPGVERVDERGYARTVATGDGHAIVCVRPLETEEALELRVCGAPAAALFHLSSLARSAFDLAADPARIVFAFGSDTLLAPLARRRPGLRIPGAWDPFECAVRAVLGQQVSVAAGRTFAARVVARIGRTITNGEPGLTHLFPTAAEVAAAELEGLGLTRARIGALRALAKTVVSGELNFHGPVEEVMAALMSLPGIGAWTAQYVALRALNEPDAFPAADIVLQRMAAKNGRPMTTRALEARAEAWRPWRGYAVMHLWRSATDSVQERAVQPWNPEVTKGDGLHDRIH
ncbi:MAG: helix-turn-helix domain-containing protein [Acidobacteriales bacterium]|nr:helix-turn-helix domain-containing protein [Terriglobales bacterium]